MKINNYILKSAAAAILAAVLMLAPESIYAQGRSRQSSGGSSRSSSSVSRSSSSSRPSGSVSRQAAPISRSSGSVSRPSTNSSRQAAPSTQNRSGSATSRQAAPSTQNRSGSATSRQAAPSTQNRSGSATSRQAVPGRQPAQGNVNGRQAAPGGRSASPRPSAGQRVEPRGGLRPVEPRHYERRMPPRQRPFIEHTHVTIFYSPGPHYFGYRVQTLPARYIRRAYWGYDYYICDGIYYRFWDNCYYICRPPFGILFDRALYNLELMACDFAYYNTVARTYKIINENYRTIEEQNAIIAQNNATIAAQNAAIASGNVAANASFELASRLGLVQSFANAGQQYYYDDGIFFIETSDGQYQTIVPPAGALISDLPDDYEIINLSGTDYYKVDDTVYRTVVVEGKARFEVLGQLQK